MAGPRSAKNGFTLLETLVALTVLGLLMVALVQGVRSGNDFWRIQQHRTAATAGLDASARVLRTILTTIPIEPASVGAAASIRFKGQPEQIGLVGELPTGFGTTRLVDLTMSLQNGRVVIAWAPYRHDQGDTPPQSPTVTELIGGVRLLEFAYWGSATPDAPAAWLARWDGPTLPGLVRIRIGFGAGDNRRWPDLIVAPQF